MNPGEVVEAVYRGRGYSVKVFKNPKVGSKPPRAVPFVTAPTPLNSLHTSMTMRFRLWLQPIVFWRTACIMSTKWPWNTGKLVVSSQEASTTEYNHNLQMKWSVPRKTSLWDFQWSLAEQIVPDHFTPKAEDVPTLIECVCGEEKAPCKPCTWSQCVVCETYFYDPCLPQPIPPSFVCSRGHSAGATPLEDDFAWDKAADKLRQLVTGQGPGTTAPAPPARTHRSHHQPPRPQPPCHQILQGRRHRPPGAPHDTG